MQKFFAISGFAAAAAFGALLWAGSATAKGTYVTFDEVYASAVNAANTVTGAARSGSGFSGFIRTMDGTVTTFSVPGANQTLPSSINDAGAVAGGYDSGGFIRSPDGSITTFDIPNWPLAGVVSMNNTGEITGFYNDGVDVHAFVRAADGTITTFDGSGTPSETVPAAMNDKGMITGFYGQHGFIRAADGTITTFDPPGANSTGPATINFDGSISGIYRDDKQIEHGFVRQANGTFAIFDIQECPSLYLITGRTDKGVMSGYCLTESKHTFGFVRKPNGRIRNLNAPDSGRSTSTAGMNSSGVVVGNYRNGNFLWFP